MQSDLPSFLSSLIWSTFSLSGPPTRAPNRSAHPGQANSDEPFAAARALIGDNGTCAEKSSPSNELTNMSPA
jgi:hypothetical protein